MTYPEWTSPDGRIRLINADCLEVLPTLSGVDAVVTDPPYAVSVKGSKQGSGASGTRSLDFFDGDSDWPETTKMVAMAIAASVESDPRTVVVWCGHRQIGSVVQVLEGQGYSSRLIFWRKKCPVPSTPDAAFNSAVEQAVYAYKSGRAWNGGQMCPNIFEADSYRHGQPGKVDHPTQKPLSLMMWNVDLLTRENDVVLDPFCGSGSTGVACARLNRRFVGIEKEPKYFEIARRRLKEEVAKAAFLYPADARTALFNDQEELSA